MDIFTVNADDLLTYVREQKQQRLATSTNEAKRKTPSISLTIDDDSVPSVCFAETLCVVDDTGKELGEFVGKIRTYGTNVAGTKSITVNLHATSVSDDGDKAETSVITNTASNFDSYEEKWSQRHENESETVRKMVLISKKSGSETLDVCTELNDDGLVDQSKNIESKYITSLLTEGMNYAYLRFLAIKGFEGSIKTKTAVTINGRLCKAIYKCSVREKYEINKVCVPVVIVKRILVEEKSSAPWNLQHTMTTVLTRSGYTLKHSWGRKSVGVTRELAISKSMRITQDGCVHSDWMPDALLENNWDQDICLKSMYLDKVSEIRTKYKNYLKINGAVKNMIVDYIKEILIAKPNDVLQFSIDYFSAL